MQNKVIVAASSALALAVLSVAAHATTAIVPFTGIVTSACVLTVGTPGVLGTSADFTTMSSTAAGGIALRLKLPQPQSGQAVLVF